MKAKQLSRKNRSKTESELLIACEEALTYIIRNSAQVKGKSSGHTVGPDNSWVMLNSPQQGKVINQLSAAIAKAKNI